MENFIFCVVKSEKSFRSMINVYLDQNIRDIGLIGKTNQMLKVHLSVKRWSFHSGSKVQRPWRPVAI